MAKAWARQVMMTVGQEWSDVNGELTQGIEPGLVSEHEFQVTEMDTAAALGSGLVAGLATPRLLAWMERVAFQAVVPQLLQGQTTVGTRVSLEHLAATPAGGQVRVRAELAHVEGRQLRFHVEAWDAVDLIGRAEHDRFIVDEERFARGLERKRGAETPS